ncbi:DNase I-like protein [Tilletiaria anomala UBC 951]|uniref:DNase I-like protein n=1 Tax=Tilletiaria anomala (strain ATCC 24038 / CBS 436.72 / UBC 951) TaxID=1037660 RepID=A0A066WJB1_TILAU|nr:DNase I-like protein [Tilletiaria anomala UBC 951]KDN52648.1 DNase I-like protein [Tilletiaria anomala UBC 951]
MDLGRYVWIGMANGHIWELDTSEGKEVASRTNLHGEAIIKMVRVGSGMIIIDEGGKMSIWMPRKNGAGVLALVTLDMQPFTQRIPFDHKVSLPLILGDQLWVATDPPHDRKHQAKEAFGRRRSGPSITVHNPFADNKPFNALSRPATIPPEMLDSVGSITSGAIIPMQPHVVYLGHESGHISIWSRDRLQCQSVLMCTQHGITSLAGVVNFLWASNKAGKIIVYDVSERPFKILKLWPAHTEPVIGMRVDSFGINIGRLQVASGGQDGHVQIWDGLLATDWIEGELNKREREFCTHRPIRTLQLTWNIDAAEPEDLNADQENFEFLPRFLSSGERPDIIIFGLQELIDLEDKRLTAKSLLLGKKKVGHELGDRISSQYRKWEDKLVSAVRLALHADEPYTLIHSEMLVGLMTCIFVRTAETGSLRDCALGIVKTGMGGRYGNKGAIVARLVVDDTSMCFVNCHLAAGQRHVQRRNENVLHIIENASVLEAGMATKAAALMAYVGGGNGEMILDHEAVFWSGDLNYRIDMKRERCLKHLSNGDLQPLLDADQLRREMNENPRFRLKTFNEAPIIFIPTYKFDRHTNQWDTSEKKRSPAWCDRILWHDRGTNKVMCLDYRRCETTVSDHRPV